MSGVIAAMSNVVNAASAQGKAPLVASAVSDWYDNHEANFVDIADWISNAVSNTKSAVNAYLKHDEDTALQYQRKVK